MVALIGSGELSGTMVETHKLLLASPGVQGPALFLDTPAGFQENVDLLSRRAAGFFREHILHSLVPASFKSARALDSQGTDKLFRLLGSAGYVLMGPGSPTYAVRQLRDTAIPSLLSAMVKKGGSLAVASAAALTAGSHTLPVYEIYKVGQEPYWEEGLNILSALGLNVVVVPHWNNAEGGNHDTRYCYMGEKRFRFLEEKLPPESTVLGIDEHTACIIDFASGEIKVKGIGNLTIRREGREQILHSGGRMALEELTSSNEVFRQAQADYLTGKEDSAPREETLTGFWVELHHMEKTFRESLEQGNIATATNQLLEVDSLLWRAHVELENPEFVSQGRELYREMIVMTGTTRPGVGKKLSPGRNKLIGGFITLREEYRRAKRWPEADRIRHVLQESGIVIEDTPGGPQWRPTGQDPSIGSDDNNL